MNKSVLLFTILLSVFTFAAAEEQTTEPTDVSSEINSEIKANSTSNRMNKNYTVTGEILGVGPSGVYGQGIQFGFFLDESSLITIEINGGKNSIDEGFLFTWGDSLHQEGYSVGAHYKRFVGNSFYLKGGGDYRTIKRKYTDEFWFSSDESTREFSGESVAVALALGNQWQMENFTIGCDWFGLELPVASRVYNVRYSANATEYDRKDNREDMNRLVKGVGYTALRFYMGASF